MELLERLDEIGLELEHRAQRIFPQLLHPSRGRLDRELLDVELRRHLAPLERDRKSTRLNSSHGYISYAVFCLKKKKKVIMTKISYKLHQLYMHHHCRVCFI